MLIRSSRAKPDLTHFILLQLVAEHFIFPLQFFQFFLMALTQLELLSTHSFDLNKITADLLPQAGTRFPILLILIAQVHAD